MEILLRSDPCIQRIFKGVYAYDKLPTSIPAYPAAYIINTAPSNTPGEHWVCVYFESENRSEYFDSYGMYPFGEIYAFAKRNANKVFYNKKWLQSPDSVVCGAYCIYFLHFRVRGYNILDIINHFEEYNWVGNDKIVRDVLTVFVEDI